MNMPNFKSQLPNKIKSRCAVNENGCWVWQGSLNDEGYGHIKTFGKIIATHIIVYEHFVGKIPKGYEIDHLCKNHACCNYEHLEAVPHKINVQRGGSAKLTAAQVEEIRAEASRWHPTKNGNLHTQLAKKYNVSISQIGHIINKESWT